MVLFFMVLFLSSVFICVVTLAFGNSSHKLDFYPAELYLPTLFSHFFIATVNLAGEP